MWRDAGVDLAAFDGRSAGECLYALEAGIRVLRLFPGKYQAMDPPNGWGSYRTLVPALEQLAEQFRSHPKATVQVSR